MRAHRLPFVFGLSLLTLIAPVAARPQSTPAPPPAPAPAPVYDARFVVEDAVEYTGATTFQVAAGQVTGALTIAGPLEGTGTLSGPVRDGTWAARIEFTLTTQACTGVVAGTAAIPDDGRMITGKAIITSTCTPAPQNAVFTLSRR